MASGGGARAHLSVPGRGTLAPPGPLEDVALPGLRRLSEDRGGPDAAAVQRGLDEVGPGEGRA